MFFLDQDLYQRLFETNGSDTGAEIPVLSMGDQNSCECPTWSMLALSSYFASSLEVFLRAFALGFGAHMLTLLFWEKRDVDFDEVKKRLPISLISGVAVACFVFGSSFFLPAQFRINWFEYE